MSKEDFPGRKDTDINLFRISDAEALSAQLFEVKEFKRAKIDELLGALANNQYVLDLVSENPQLLVDDKDIDVGQIAKENARLLQEILTMATDISSTGAEILRTHLHQDQLRTELLSKLRLRQEDSPNLDHPDTVD